MQVVDTKLIAYLKQQYCAPLSWESMGISAFLIFAVWTSSTTYLTFGKGELQNVNHFLSLYSYFSPCYLIFHHSLLPFRWFTIADALSLKRVVMTKLKPYSSHQMSCLTYVLDVFAIILWWDPRIFLLKI